ncbi:MAG: formyltransferase [Steroidobacteraceae bacterium]
MSPRAIVFGYHDVGVRCLEVLLSGGVEIPLVVTHADDPAEQRWFASVRETALAYGLETIIPATVDEELQRRIAGLAPDFIFSFYYRSLLPLPVLQAARRGALNMHGSMLPAFRGRAPVNWAILSGATHSGATLHHMVERADAGDIVDQLAVPILQNDDARQVMGKVTVAAEIVLARSLPKLIDGSAVRRPQDLSAGRYFGRRGPQDGLIDWSRSARSIHDLVRAVAPPFPGAFGVIRGERWNIDRTRMIAQPDFPSGPAMERSRLQCAAGRCYVHSSSGGVLEILAARCADAERDLADLATRHDGGELVL